MYFSGFYNWGGMTFILGFRLVQIGLFHSCHARPHTRKACGRPTRDPDSSIATLYFNCICTLARTVSSLVEKDLIGEFLRNHGPSLTPFGDHVLPGASQVATAVSLLRSKSVGSRLGSLSLSLYLFSSVMSFSSKSVSFHGSTNSSVSRCWICISACEELSFKSVSWILILPWKIRITEYGFKFSHVRVLDREISSFRFRFRLS